MSLKFLYPKGKHNGPICNIRSRQNRQLEWFEGLKRAKLKRIEYSCAGSTNAENIGEKVRIMAELQDAGGVIIGNIHMENAAEIQRRISELKID